MERGAGLGLAVDLNTSFQELPVVGRSCEVAGDGKKLIARGVGTVALKPRMETARGDWRDDSVAKIRMCCSQRGLVQFPACTWGSSYPPGALDLWSLQVAGLTCTHPSQNTHIYAIFFFLKKKQQGDIS